jgi:TrmH family RNA methyltransferase
MSADHATTDTVLPELPRAAARRLRALSSRQGRRKSDYFVCEGHTCCHEALALQPAWVEWALVTDSSGLEADALPCPCYRADAAAFAELALTEQPQGVLLLLRRPGPPPSPPTAPLLLILDRVADPGNVGTMLRSAWAAGLPDVGYIAGTADPFGAKAIRAGMGAQFGVRLHRYADLAEARAATAADYPDAWIAAADGEVSCFDDAFAAAQTLLVLGNEAHGAGNLPGARRVAIPMPGGSESLNVAQAATLLVFEHVRRRLTAQPKDD